MKKLFKVAGLLLLLLIGAIIAVPIIFKDKIVEFAKEEINANVNAEVQFGDFSLSLISNFPNFTLQLEDFKINGVDSFAGTTLADIKHLEFTLDVMSVIRGNTIVKKIEVDNATINALVLKSGIANYDILLETDSATTEVSDTASGFKMVLEDYQFKNCTINYENRSGGMALELKGLNHSGSGEFSSENFQLKTLTNAESGTFDYEGVKYLSNADMEIKATFDVSDDFRNYEIKDNEIRVNNLFLVAEGLVRMPEDGVEMDINFQGQKTDLASVLSLVPKEYMPDMTGMVATGGVDLNGKFFGRYDDINLPGYEINFVIDNGKVQYEGFPESITDIFVNTQIAFPGGPDLNLNTVNISKFNAKLADNPISGKLFLATMLTDPKIIAELVTQINLDDLQNIMPLEATMSGIITGDIKIDGNYSAIEKQDYNKFKAEGSILIQDLIYESGELPYKTSVSYAEGNFSPQKIEIVRLNSTVGNSNFEGSGKITNYLAYVLKDEPITGNFKVKADQLDLNEFMTEDDESGTGETAVEESSPFLIPGNLDLKIDASADKVLYENLVLSNVTGGLAIKDETATLGDMRMNVFNGSMVMNGSYSSKNPEKPVVDFDLDVENLDIKSSTSLFESLGKFAPIAEKCTGLFSSSLKINATLDDKLNPIYESLTGNGNMVTKKVFIEGFEPLNKLASTLKIDKLSKQTINDVKMNFEFKQGRLFVQPFDINMQGIAANISGSTGFAQDIDYVMKLDIPTEMFGGNLTGALQGLLDKANVLGANLKVGDKIKMDVLIGGTIQDPVIKPSLSGTQAGGSVKEALVDVVKNAVTAKKDSTIKDVKADARKEADKIIADAQVQADNLISEASKLAKTIRDEGEKNALKIENEAKNPLAKIAAKAAADKVRKEANSKADGVEREAKTKADGIMAKARQQADDKLK